MVRYLLDTTVLVDISNRIEPVSSQVRALLVGPDEVGVSAVSVAEFFAGLRPEDRPRWEAFLDQTDHWNITREIAVQAGVYRYAYVRLGRAISTPDALIAATALAIGATLLTNNVRHFPMPELRLLRIGT